MGTCVLVALRLSGNGLTGSLVEADVPRTSPDILAKLEHLAVLEMEDNALKEFLPSDTLLDLSRLRVWLHATPRPLSPQQESLTSLRTRELPFSPARRAHRC